MRDFPAFSACCKFLPAASGLRTVYESFEQRQLIRSDDLECSATLGNQRDEIRTMLKEHKLVNDLDSVQPLFVSTWIVVIKYLLIKFELIRHGYGVWYEQKQISTVQVHTSKHLLQKSITAQASTK
jgi:hypothetical protein